MSKGPGRWADGIVLGHPGRPTPGFVRLLSRYVAPVVRLMHRPTLEGIEHLPETGAFLLVANHSAGLGASEILAFIVMYLEKVGAERPLAGFAHPFGFKVFPLSLAARGIGAIPSSYEWAHKAIAAGIPILVFPGGDHETLRPIWQANRVDFGGRFGFLRIARQAGVPIVPLGFRGAHQTAPMLLRSRLLATLLILPRAIGQKRWGISLLGVIGAALIVKYAPVSWPISALLVVLWLQSPLVFVPWVPWTIRIRIGPPLQATELFGMGHADDGTDEELRRVLPRVQAAVQALVDR